MRVFVTPDRIELGPWVGPTGLGGLGGLGGPVGTAGANPANTVEVLITVHNTGTLIGGYQVRVLGADPSWVALQTDSLSLFPDESQTVTATIAVPDGVAAGERRMAVQVRELTPPFAISINELELLVPAAEELGVQLTPMTVIGGGHGMFGVLLHNTGNTTITTELAGRDAEDVMWFEFEPAVVTLAPGDQAISDLRASGPRRWFGQPVVRPFGVLLAAPGSVPPPVRRSRGWLPTGLVPKKVKLPKGPALPPVPKLPAGGGAPGLPAAPKVPGVKTPAIKAPAVKVPQLTVPRPPSELTIPAWGGPDAGPGSGPEPAQAPSPPEPVATGTLLQKPRLSRGVLSLLSLLVAATVFATVITIALSALVSQSAADRNLAIAVAAARNSGTPSGSSSLSGSVLQLTNGQPIAGVSVELFAAQDVTAPVANTATGDDGTWTIGNLPAGTYVFRVRGAGFSDLWYANALTAADAKQIILQVGQQIGDLTVNLGGLPATVSGQVTGVDVAGAVLTVQVPAADLPAANSAAVAAAEAPPAAGTPAGAVLTTVPIGSNGTFDLSDVPSPAVYDLVLSKAGFATDTQRIDLSGGEVRGDIQLRLQAGDGLISGTVTGPDGPLGGAVITATAGTTSVETVSLTEGQIGAFTLRGLVTPATYTVTVTSPGFTTQTTSAVLADEQKLTGVQLSLARSSGSLSGQVTTLPGNAPAPGVTVVVSSGATQVQTVTQSTGTVGAWSIGGLPIPGSYTITFSRDDLQKQTLAVNLDASGASTGGSGGISVAMTSAVAEISGVVSQRATDGTVTVAGEAQVTLSSGSDTYTVTSASEPSSAVGAYRVGGVLPGTYTLSVSRPGTSPTSVIVTLAAGQSLTMNPVLIPPASIGGIVRGADGSTMPGVQVALFKASEYPAQPTSTTTTDASGRYSFPQVDAPQAYVLEVRSSTQGTLGSSTLVLAASQAAQIDITVGTRSITPTTTSPAPAPAAAPASVAPTTTETTPTTTAVVGSP
jgi:5-hydroxyisourate hydrolase-like protein (transthyretin family)